MPNPGVFLALCTLFLAADSLAGPAAIGETVPQPAPCRFTLERKVQAESADGAAEIWVLTSHCNRAPSGPDAQAGARDDGLGRRNASAPPANVDAVQGRIGTPADSWMNSIVQDAFGVFRNVAGLYRGASRGE
jgi:hypothetical protein